MEAHPGRESSFMGRDSVSMSLGDMASMEKAVDESVAKAASAEQVSLSLFTTSSPLRHLPSLCLFRSLSLDKEKAG